MKTKRYRLDRFLSQELQTSKKQIQRFLAQGLVSVDNQPTNDPQTQVDEFSIVVFEGKILQQRQRHYLMMNKPDNVISATIDANQATVLDLIDLSTKMELHIAGRLDKHSIGLLLLTNDGRWSKRLSDAEHHCEKKYQVRVQNPISDDCIEAFAKGFYFETENITTKPAMLVRLSDTEAEVTISEGRYHQIKRMFGRFRNPVLTIHRTTIGRIELDKNLKPGEYRALTTEEINSGNSSEH